MLIVLILKRLIEPRVNLPTTSLPTANNQCIAVYTIVYADAYSCCGYKKNVLQGHGGTNAQDEAIMFFAGSGVVVASSLSL